MTIRELLRRARLRLEQAGCDAPRLDAELLLMHAGRYSRIDLIVRADENVPATLTADFDALLVRRCRREPLAYILGEKEFWSRRFRVTPDVLIPRPETEHLIEAVLARFPERSRAYRFCDIGTGSGCIAVTLACEYPQAQVIATDISEPALNVARDNAAAHNVSGRMTFRHGDLLAALQAQDGPFDAIISNPPYVAEQEMAELAPELALEPRHALTDNGDGLRLLHTLLQEAPAQLRGGGYIILETGLCGLPDTPAPDAPTKLCFEQPIHDLAGLLRGGVYHLQQATDI